MAHCPRCKQELQDEFELFKHLRDVHHMTTEESKRASGWYEKQQQTPAGEIKAIEHQLAQLKAQTAKEYSNTMTVPMPAPKREEMKVPTGWMKGNDGCFIFERNLGTVHTSTNAITKILKGKVTQNHGELILFRLDKDISELVSLQEKATTLESRMSALVIDDPGFVNVSSELQQTRKRVRELNKGLKAEQSTETVLEDYYYNDFGTAEHEAWQTKFMESCISEASRVAKNAKNEDEDDDKK